MKQNKISFFFFLVNVASRSSDPKFRKLNVCHCEVMATQARRRCCSGRNTKTFQVEPLKNNTNGMDHFPPLRKWLSFHSSHKSSLPLTTVVPVWKALLLGRNHCATQLVRVPNQSRGATCRFIPAAKLSLPFDGVVNTKTPELAGRFGAWCDACNLVWTAAKSACVCVFVCACRQSFALLHHCWILLECKVFAVKTQTALEGSFRPPDELLAGVLFKQVHHQVAIRSVRRCKQVAPVEVYRFTQADLKYVGWISEALNKCLVVFSQEINMFSLNMENAKPTILIFTSPDKSYSLDTLNAKVHIYVSRLNLFFV